MLSGQILEGTNQQLWLLMSWKNLRKMILMQIVSRYLINTEQIMVIFGEQQVLLNELGGKNTSVQQDCVGW